MCGEKMSRLAIPKHSSVEEFMTEEEKVLMRARIACPKEMRMHALKTECSNKFCR